MLRSLIETERPLRCSMMISDPDVYQKSENGNVLGIAEASWLVPLP